MSVEVHLLIEISPLLAGFVHQAGLDHHPSDLFADLVDFGDHVGHVLASEVVFELRELDFFIAGRLRWPGIDLYVFEFGGDFVEGV